MPQSSTTAFSGIFVSYRREDAAGHAGRLFDRLVSHFGRDRIFMDVDAIEPGQDFVTVIENAVGSCEILIAVIGKDWLSSTGRTTGRLNNPNDFVRLEIGTALSRDVRVIPVLVERASMPKPEDLPEDLVKLTRRNAVELSDLRWQTDVEQLISVMERVLAQREEARLDEAARQAEAERQRQKALEAKRLEEEKKLRSADEDATQRAVAKPPPEKQELERIEAEKRAQREAEEAKRRRRKKLMLLVIIAAVVVLTVVAVIWIRPTLKGEQHSTNRNASIQQTGQTTSAPSTGPTQPPPGMVYVPGGEFMMGRDDGDEYEKPAHLEKLKAFFIDTYEVTCGDYERFVKEDSHPAPPDWKGGACPADATRKPVTGVTWGDAVAFCHWRSKRLPTEQEWEFAARGTDGRLYPWGKRWRAGVANAYGASANMLEVGSFPEGKSPFGAFDMVGNAWEWTTADMTAYPGGKLPPDEPTGTKVLRGGTYKSNKHEATATYRLGWKTSGATNYATSGFRCVKDVPDSSPQK